LLLGAPKSVAQKKLLLVPQRTQTRKTKKGQNQGALVQARIEPYRGQYSARKEMPAKFSPIKRGEKS